MGCFLSYCAKMLLNFLAFAEPALAFLPGLAAQVWLLSQAPLYPVPLHWGGGQADKLSFCGDKTGSWRYLLPQQSSGADRCLSSANLIYSPSKTHKHACTRIGCMFSCSCILSPGTLSLMEGGCMHTIGLNPLLAALQICQACGEKRSCWQLPLLLRTQQDRS